MKNQRIIFALLWVVSIVVAYLAGGSGAPPQQQTPPAGTNTVSNTAAGGDSPGRRAVVEKFDGAGFDRDPLAGGDIPAIIARVRVEMGTGMGGMMNMRGMVRAIAPLVELSDAQLQEALAEVTKTVSEPQQKMMFYSILLGQWAEKDGRAALDYAEANLQKNSMYDFGVKAGIIGSWARTNPEAAWKWFESEGKNDGDNRNMMSVVHTLFAGLAARDMDNALARLQTLDETQRGMALNGISVSAMTTEGRQRLLDRTASLPQGTRDTLRQNVLRQWAMAAPDDALAWARKQPEAEQKPLVDSIGQSMLMMNPKQAAGVLLQNATDEERPRIYDQVVGQWALSDARAAGEWLGSQPQGEELDNARMTYAVIVAMKDAPAAMDWAKSVVKPESRETSVRQVYHRWKSHDAAAADAALDASGLAPDRIEAIRKLPLPDGTAPVTLPPVRVR